GLNHLITGLVNGTPYTFTVTATNSGAQLAPPGTVVPLTGPASLPTNSVTPAPTAAVPPAPTIGSASAGNAQATVNFTPPTCVAPPVGPCPPITNYTVTSSPGGVTASGGASPIVVPGLTNGTAYTFTVTATNSVGTGAPSAASSPAVTPATVPGAPTIGTATAGNTQVSVSFTPPASNGGAA